MSTVLDVAATVRSSSVSCIMIGVLPDHAVDAEPVVELGTEVGVLSFQPAFLECRVDLVQQLLELEWLRDEPLGALTGDLDGLPDGAEAGDDDGDDLRVASECLVEDLPAVDARQTQIRNQDVEGKLTESSQRLFPAPRLLDAEAVLGQSLGHHLAKRRFVIHEQQVEC